MTEIIVILSFILTLTGCLFFHISIVTALVIGYFIFSGYALYKGFILKELALMTVRGLKTVKNILITFILIGILTALWRCGGVVASIICYSFELVNPSIFLCMTFILTSVVSFLTGTSLGTAATMGVICMTMCISLGVSPLMAGGAIMSGAYFGDRCSPVSTSAMLVGEMTETDLYDNIIAMMKTGLVPLIISSLLYLLLGMNTRGVTVEIDVRALFSAEFRIGYVCLIPALIIVVLALFRVKVKATLSVSIAAAFLVSLFFEKLSVSELLYFSLYGFSAKQESVGAMLNGGGILSMTKVAAIVSLSSSYSGIFDSTGLLDGIKEKITEIAERITVFGTTVLASVLTSMISCNQSMAIILTSNLCRDLFHDKRRLAVYLENSAVVIAPLIPWTVASTTPLRTIDAPPKALLFAFYLYLLPLWQFILSNWQNRRCKIEK